MAHPAQLRSEISLIFLIMLVLLGTSMRLFLPSECNIPSVYHLIDNQGFTSKKGLTYWQKEPFSGWQYALSSTGDTLALIPFWQGKIQGCKKTWYAKGKLKEVRFFEAGWQTGQHRGWWENGQLKFEYHFENDVYEGLCQEWHENGQISQIRHYSEGKESGKQSVWRIDGSLQANYIAKNGRNYGLIGVKNCVNKKDK